MEQVLFQDLGRISYQQAWDYQTSLHQKLVEAKLAQRQLPTMNLPPHHLLFCEHPPVYTLGKSGSLDHLLLDATALENQGFEFFKINRGGDITYHGPGQLVGYPILDLERFFTDVHRYVRSLEEVIIRTLANYGLEGKRVAKYTGVWLGDEGRNMRKICAIGVHLGRWVTLHGFAFNINTQLEHFSNIIPCGIQEEHLGVTSLQQELGHALDLAEVKAQVQRHFAVVFDCQLEGGVKSAS